MTTRKVLVDTRFGFYGIVAFIFFGLLFFFELRDRCLLFLGESVERFESGYFTL